MRSMKRLILLVVSFVILSAGLEGFEVSVDDKKIAKHSSNVCMHGARGSKLTGRNFKVSKDGDWEKRIAGYYEIEIPQEALVRGAKNINLKWVDFYR